MKKYKSTYERLISDPKQKKIFEKELKEFALSELVLAAMENDHISVRRLAKMAGISPTIVQGLKSGNKTNITLDTMQKILDAIGYQIIFVPKNNQSKLKH